jgi:hypothetical protein
METAAMSLPRPLRTALFLLTVACLASACSRSQPSEAPPAPTEPPPPSAADLELQDATAAANAVIASASDCAAVTRGLPAALTKINKAAGSNNTVAGQEALTALERQVRAAAEACDNARLQQMRDPAPVPVPEESYGGQGSGGAQEPPPAANTPLVEE